MTLPALQLQTVTKRYGDQVVVDAISLEAKPGEMICLLGPSGCGKTTTLRMIAGFERVDAGAIWIGGVNMTAQPVEKRDIGFVFQNYALFPHMTVTQNVGFGLRMRGWRPAAMAEAVRDALSLVHLDGYGNRLPRELSGGQQQRVALARAIAIRPRLLLLDEPLSNLDATLRTALRDEIRRVQREVGLTAILVTHDQSEALAIADRIAVMRQGRIVQCDTPEVIYERPADAFVAGFIGQANLLAGEIGDVLDGRASLRLPGVELRGLAAPGLRPHGKGLAVIKADRVRLSSAPGGVGHTSMPVRIELATFEGATVSYNVAGTGAALTIVASTADQSRLKPGDTGYASWREEDCLILNAPDTSAGALR